MPLPPGFDPAVHVLVPCEPCKGTGILRRYPADSQWCEPCGGTGTAKRHRTDVTEYGCNRCVYTWPASAGPYCPTCGADATHYLFKS